MHYHVSHLQLRISLPSLSFQGGVNALESFRLPGHYSITCVSLLQRREEKKRRLLGGVMMLSVGRGAREREAVREHQG